MEQDKTYKYTFKSKDHLVTGEYFNITWNKIKTVAKTDIENIKDISLYYDSKNYDSFKNEAKGVLDIMYFLTQQIMFRYKLFLIKVHLKRNRILDYGAGSGKFASYLSKKSFKTSIVEPYNKKTNNVSQLNIDVFENIADIPKSYKYDGVTLWHVLEHLPNPENILTKIHSILETNGVLMIAVPNINSLDAKYYESNWAALDVPRHIWHFTSKGLISLVESRGFKLTKKHPLWFDAFYISYISEKNKKSRFALIRALFIAIGSNITALINKEYSSLIYIFKRTT